MADVTNAGFLRLVGALSVRTDTGFRARASAGAIKIAESLIRFGDEVNLVLLHRMLALRPRTKWLQMTQLVNMRVSSTAQRYGAQVAAPALRPATILSHRTVSDGCAAHGHWTQANCYCLSIKDVCGRLCIAACRLEWLP